MTLGLKIIILQSFYAKIMDEKLYKIEPAKFTNISPETSNIKL